MTYTGKINLGTEIDKATSWKETCCDSLIKWLDRNPTLNKLDLCYAGSF